MALLITGSRILLKFNCYMDGQLGLMIKHAKVTEASPSPKSDFAWSAALGAYYNAAVTALLCDRALFYGVGVQLLLPLTAEAKAFTFPTNGTAGDEPMPKQISGLITLRSDFPGRTGRGRAYVPFPSMDDQNTVTNKPSAGYVSRLDSLAALLVAEQTITVGGELNKFQLTDVPGPNLMVQSASRTQWATQRRRGDFGSPNAVPG